VYAATVNWLAHPAPEAVYFSGQPRFETGDPRWAWLSDRQFVARGQRAANAVLLTVWMLA